MPRITISYRRDDSLDITGRIFDRLAAHFGRESVFRDIDNIPPGADFRRHIDQVLDESDIILAIVGPRWIGPGRGQNRLASAADPVRLEIETALRKDKPLVPVLVSRALMPRPDQLPESINDFAYRNAVPVDSSQNFENDVSRLIRSMERISGSATKQETHGTVPPPDLGDTLPDQGPPLDPNLIAQIATLREANRDLEQQVVMLTDARDERARQAATLREEISRVLLGKEAELKELAEQLAAARDDGALQADEAADLEGQIKSRDAQIERLSSELAAGRPVDLPSSRRSVRAFTVLSAMGAILLVAATYAATRSLWPSGSLDLPAEIERVRAAQKAADDKALTAEQDNTRAARSQVDQLNAQIKSLRDQNSQLDAARTEGQRPLPNTYPVSCSIGATVTDRASGFGALVTAVTAGSGAFNVGISNNDIIGSFNGVNIFRAADLEIELKRLQKSGSVSIQFLHKDETFPRNRMVEVVCPR
jgi:hypothetical protein